MIRWKWNLRFHSMGVLKFESFIYSWNLFSTNFIQFLPFFLSSPQYVCMLAFTLSLCFHITLMQFVGKAFEARIYAENLARVFLPATRVLNIIFLTSTGIQIE